MEGKFRIKQYFEKVHGTISKFYPLYKDIALPFEGKSDMHNDWINRFYTTHIFRHLHLEYYNTNKITVLHSNSFPNIYSSDPIMGFDLISIGNKVTGIFFDFSPILKRDEFHLNRSLINLTKKYKSPARALPSWANFFSNNFYCVSPLEDEIDNILEDINIAISQYFEYMTAYNFLHKTVIQKQNEYCTGQKKNDKTFSALAAEIGKDNAKIFLNKYLFPEIDLLT